MVKSINVRGKTYGLIINCMQTRAVHVELCPDYSTDKFLLASRKFVAIRGYPANIYSYQCSQLVSAEKESKAVLEDLDWNKIEDYGASGVKWNFTPGDSTGGKWSLRSTYKICQEVINT